MLVVNNNGCNLTNYNENVPYLQILKGVFRIPVISVRSSIEICNHLVHSLKVPLNDFASQEPKKNDNEGSFQDNLTTATAITTKTDLMYQWMERLDLKKTVVRNQDDNLNNNGFIWTMD
jgi:hypothetical protein